jgi:antitoxin component of MazEF toxin-antitoxin module
MHEPDIIEALPSSNSGAARTPNELMGSVKFSDEDTIIFGIQNGESLINNELWR